MCPDRGRWIGDLRAGLDEDRDRGEAVGEHHLHRVAAVHAALDFLGPAEAVRCRHDPAVPGEIDRAVVTAHDGPAVGDPRGAQCGSVDALADAHIAERDLLDHFPALVQRLRPQQQSGCAVEPQPVRIAQVVARRERQRLRLETGHALHRAELRLVTLQDLVGRGVGQRREGFLDSALLDQDLLRFGDQALNLVVAVGALAQVLARLAVEGLDALERLRSVEQVRDARRRHVAARLVDDRSGVVDSLRGRAGGLDPLRLGARRLAAGLLCVGTERQPRHPGDDQGAKPSPRGSRGAPPLAGRTTLHQRSPPLVRR
jgi:hypothetical protein